MPLDDVGGFGCAYIVSLFDRDHPKPRTCGEQQKSNSPYCPKHHAICHIEIGSPAERKGIAEIDRAGAFVGGKFGGRGQPTARFLSTLEKRLRARMRS
jgi:hypothetical protein